MDFTVLISNPLINVGLISWIIAQLIKTGTCLVKYKNFDVGRLMGAGGMPSSHTAIVCSSTTMAFYQYGFSSPEFAILFILAFIVMYDATGVRWAAGLHAKAINNLVEYLDDNKTHDKAELDAVIPKLNESLGHRVIEVFAGAALGFAISTLTYLL